MSAIEDRLRGTIEAGQHSDPAFRQSVYRAAGRALEKVLEKGNHPAELMDRQRSRLGEAVARVEATYLEMHGGGEVQPAAPVVAAFSPQPHVEPVPVRRPASEDTHPTARLGVRESVTTPETISPLPVSDADWRPGNRRPVRRSRWWVVVWAFAAMLLLAAGVYLLNPFFLGLGGYLPGASTPVQEEQAGAWIDVFTSADLTAVSTPDGGRAEAVSRPDGTQVLRIAGPEGQTGDFHIAIGPGLVRQMRGRTVRVELAAGSPDGAAREFSLACSFEAASGCVRQRLSATGPRTDHVFDMEVPGNASGGGFVALQPGANGGARDLDVYSIRMRILN